MKEMMKIGVMKRTGKKMLLSVPFILCILFVPVLLSCRPHKSHSMVVSSHKSSIKDEQSMKDALPVEEEEPIKYELEILLPKQRDNSDGVILERKSYYCSYNKDYRCANWSAWYLPKTHADGPYKRNNLNIPGNYLEDDPSLDGRQLLSDWYGISGYDHGHLCPSGDNKWSLEAMKQTFFLSNMCVQNSSLNQGAWENLESSCRGWAKKFGGLYIVTGPVFTNKIVKKIGNNLSVPDQFFKVVLDIESKNPKAIGFLYDNSAPSEKEKIESHVKTVDQIETITGFDFFSGLADSLENRIESNADIKDWIIYK